MIKTFVPLFIESIIKKNTFLVLRSNLEQKNIWDLNITEKTKVFKGKTCNNMTCGKMIF